MSVEHDSEGLSIAPRNALCYRAYIRLLKGTDMAQVAALYRRFYPLFQRAYADVGPADAYFNDRLVTAIDDLLATPDDEPPIRLLQPKVFYTFADPALEARSAGQKIMTRIGRDNAQVVKAKLRDLRALVAQQSK